jgi:release factor glutamine methyltransferase
VKEDFSPFTLHPSPFQPLLAWGAGRIGRQDSEFILASLLNARYGKLYEVPTPIDAAFAGRFQGLVAEVERGTPVEYLLHKAVFMDFELFVDERVLIPRAETEELVLRAKQKLKGSRAQKLKSSRPLSILDLGTGSGAIAIALARLLPSAVILATDISPDALDVCRLNVARHGLTERIELKQSDLFDDLEPWVHSFNLIVANPPYVPTGQWARLAASVRDHEPRQALDAGPDGMKYIRPILTQAPKYLACGGLLAMEIDPLVSAEVRRAAPEVVIENDLPGLERYCFLTTSSVVRRASCDVRRSTLDARRPTFF